MKEFSKTITHSAKRSGVTKSIFEQAQEWAQKQADAMQKNVYFSSPNKGEYLTTFTEPANKESIIKIFTPTKNG